MTNPITSQPAPEPPGHNPSTAPSDPGETLGSWLRTQRLTRKWPAFEMARQLQQAAKASGDSTVSLAIMASYIRRWEADRMGITERYRLHYCTVLDIPPRQFGPPHLWPQEGESSPPPRQTSPTPGHATTPCNIHVITLIIPSGTDITINLHDHRSNSRPAPPQTETPS